MFEKKDGGILMFSRTLFLFRIRFLFILKASISLHGNRSKIVSNLNAIRSYLKFNITNYTSLSLERGMIYLGFTSF